MFYLVSFANQLPKPDCLPMKGCLWRLTQDVKQGVLGGNAKTKEAISLFQRRHWPAIIVKTDSLLW